MLVISAIFLAREDLELKLVLQRHLSICELELALFYVIRNILSCKHMEVFLMEISKQPHGKT